LSLDVLYLDESFKNNYFEFFVKHFICLHFRKLGCWQIVFLWWYHGSLVLCFLALYEYHKANEIENRIYQNLRCIQRLRRGKFIVTNVHTEEEKNIKQLNFISHKLEKEWRKPKVSRKRIVKIRNQIENIEIEKNNQESEELCIATTNKINKP
jgi:hypothetical protein